VRNDKEKKRPIIGNWSFQARLFRTSDHKQGKMGKGRKMLGPVQSGSEWAVVVSVISGFNRQLVALQACSLGARLGGVAVVGSHGQTYGRVRMVSQLIRRTC
jgi:hypothetical protein